MDDLVIFSLRCVEKQQRLEALEGEMRRAIDKNALDALTREYDSAVADALYYAYEHWEYLDEPLRKQVLECAAELPTFLERGEE